MKPTTWMYVGAVILLLLGACGLAPVIMVDEDTFRQVKPSQISAILEPYR